MDTNNKWWRLRVTLPLILTYEASKILYLPTAIYRKNVLGFSRGQYLHTVELYVVNIQRAEGQIRTDVCIADSLQENFHRPLGDFSLLYIQYYKALFPNEKRITRDLIYCMHKLGTFLHQFLEILKNSRIKHLNYVLMSPSIAGVLLYV